MGWPAVIKEIVALLRKWGAAITAYFAGRAAGKDEVRDEIREEQDKARDTQAEKDREFERLRRDDDLRAELKRLREDAEPDGA